MKLQLNTIANTRRSLARTMREYTAGRLEESRARTLGYLFEKLLNAWRVENDSSIVERLEALEKAAGK